MQKATQRIVFCCIICPLSLFLLLFRAERKRPVVTSATSVILCKFSAHYDLMVARYNISHLCQLYLCLSVILPVIATAKQLNNIRYPSAWL